MEIKTVKGDFMKHNLYLLFISLMVAMSCSHGINNRALLVSTVEPVKGSTKKAIRAVDLAEYEQPFEQGNKLFNIGDNNYVLTSYKDIAKGKTMVLKTANGIVCLSANGKGGINIVTKQIDISKDVYAYNDNFNLIDQFGMLDNADYIQLSNVDLDGDGKNELVVTIGAPNTGLGIVSFIFTSELKYAGKVDGWDYMFLNKHRHIIAPHSALRWYDYYSYRNGEIKNLGEVNIDTSQQPSINQKKAENRLYNELRNTK